MAATYCTTSVNPVLLTVEPLVAVTLSSIAPRQRVRSGHLELNYPKLITCVAGAGNEWSKEEPIAVNVLSAARLNVLSMLRVSDAKQRMVPKRNSSGRTHNVKMLWHSMLGSRRISQNG